MPLVYVLDICLTRTDRPLFVYLFMYFFIYSFLGIFFLIEKVTKKGDMTDFYFNLSKNVAFGARGAEITKTVKEEKKEEKVNSKAKEEEWTKKQGKEAAVALQITEKGSSSSDSPSESPRFAVKDGRQGETSRPSKLLEGMTVSKTPAQDTVMSEQPMPEEPKLDHHKRSKDAVAAAKERFLARKKGKIQ